MYPQAHLTSMKTGARPSYDRQAAILSDAWLFSVDYPVGRVYALRWSVFVVWLWVCVAFLLDVVSRREAAQGMGRSGGGCRHGQEAAL